MPLYPPAPQLDLEISSIPNYIVNSTAIVLVANSALLMQRSFNRGVTVTTAWYRLGAQSGNIDLGIYDAAGNRLGSTGTFAAPAPGITLSRALTGSVTLAASTIYYLAVAADNATVAFGGFSSASTPTITGANLRAQIATSFVLPATIAVPLGGNSSNTIYVAFN